MLLARGHKSIKRQRIFAHMGINQECDFGVQLAECGVGRKRHLYEVADAAHVHEHLVRSFFRKPSAKLPNHLFCSTPAASIAAFSSPVNAKQGWVTKRGKVIHPTGFERNGESSLSQSG